MDYVLPRCSFTFCYPSTSCSGERLFVFFFRYNIVPCHICLSSTHCPSNPRHARRCPSPTTNGSRPCPHNAHFKADCDHSAVRKCNSEFVRIGPDTNRNSSVTTVSVMVPCVRLGHQCTAWWYKDSLRVCRDAHCLNDPRSGPNPIASK